MGIFLLPLHRTVDGRGGGADKRKSFDSSRRWTTHLTGGSLEPNIHQELLLVKLGIGGDLLGYRLRLGVGL